MASAQTRKPMHDALITAFQAMVHIGGSDPLFATVQKIYLDFPVSTPACSIVPTDISNNVLGVDWDERILSFSSIVYEHIEQNADQATADMKIDRLSDIEDVIMDYLHKIPNNVEGAVAGVHAHRVEISPGRYNYESSENGIRLYQIIDFDIAVRIGVKTI